VLSQGAGGFAAKGGATAQVQTNGLVVNATGAYQGVRKTIAATAAPGDYFEIQLNVDRGTTDVVRVFISESTGGGQWTEYLVGYLAPGQQTLTFTHTVSQQCQLNLTLDKDETSTLLSTTTNFRISYFMARKKGIEIIAENNYYAFGLQHKGYNNIINGGNALAQQYKYNGIEHEDALPLIITRYCFY
jgi:hypothetical protein